jgi:magnesium-transporting ATPase (P-type)
MSNPPAVTALPRASLDWHAESQQALLAHLATTKNSGLAVTEARTRLPQQAPNLLPPPQRGGSLLRLLLQFHSPLIYVLLGSGVITLWLEHYTDAGVVFGVVIINAVIGFVQEGKAERALVSTAWLLILALSIAKFFAVAAEKWLLRCLGVKKP